jgi:hypothetical protein
MTHEDDTSSLFRAERIIDGHSVPCEFTLRVKSMLSGARVVAWADRASSLLPHASTLYYTMQIKMDSFRLFTGVGNHVEP